MSFRFNFSGGGDDDSDSDGNNTAIPPTRASPVPEPAPLQPALRHSLPSLFHTLPRNISYTLLTTLAPPLPRRELYDVRMQLMAEDDLTPEREAAVGLGDEDIRTRVYEGGLKSWECSVDLAAFLSEEEEDAVAVAVAAAAAAAAGGCRVLELGCGTALPSLVLFRGMLAEGRGGTLVLADYNVDVLRLVTLPNLFLVWAASTQAGLLVEDDGKGDLHASEELKTAFVADLESRGIELVFLSGAWGVGMMEILEREGFDLVMGSETIYSPTTTPDFTDLLLGCLKVCGRGLVAAKRIYFGVGGSVEDFVGCIEKRGGWTTRIAKDIVDVGVGRVIVEVIRTTS